MRKTTILSLLIAGALPGLIRAENATLEYSTYLES